MNYLYYAPQCPNCTRFLSALEAAEDASRQVVRVDVNTLTPAQRSQLSAVPTLLTTSGTALVGAKAFEWLKQYDVAPSCYGGGRGLGFSCVDDTFSLLEYTTPYSNIDANPSWHA